MTEPVEDVISESPDIPISETPPVWTSPSFWLTLIPLLSSVAGFFFHDEIDLSDEAAGIALIAASISTGALALARALRHKAVLEANTQAMIQRNAVRPDTVTREQVQKVVDLIGADITRLERTLNEQVLPAVQAKSEVITPPPPPGEQG
jgi:hypothetical protein